MPDLYQGIPRISEYQELLKSPFFQEIENRSNLFIKSLEPIYQQTQLKNWPWPLDPLHTWSRLWEYPFSIYQIARWKAYENRYVMPRLLDLGAGLTFLPHYYAKQGWQVTCCDGDPRLVPIFKLAGLDQQSTLDIMDLRSLNYPESAFDSVQCISVLEHLQTEEHQQAIHEIHRILKPGGVIVITFDVCMDPSTNLNITASHRLLNVFEKLFQIDLAEVHHNLELLEECPEEYLTTDWIRQVSPYMLPWKFSWRYALKRLAQLRSPEKPFRLLSICCLALQKS